MRYLLMQLRKFLWIKRQIRRHTISFQKYQVAPRQGARVVQRRLLARVFRGNKSSLTEAEPSTEC
jgi:hypothetical protein